MNFKQLAVCPPAILKDQRFGEKIKRYRLIKGICIYLHSFCFMLIYLLLSELLLQCLCVSYFFFCAAIIIKQHCLFVILFLQFFNVFWKCNLSVFILSFLKCSFHSQKVKLRLSHRRWLRDWFNFLLLWFHC